MPPSASSARHDVGLAVEAARSSQLRVVEHEVTGTGRGRSPAPMPSIRVGPAQFAAAVQARQSRVWSSRFTSGEYNQCAPSPPARPSGTFSVAGALHCSDGRDRTCMRSGSAIRPSFTPSSASHASTTALCSSLRFRRRESRRFVLSAPARRGPPARRGRSSRAPARRR